MTSTLRLPLLAAVLFVFIAGFGAHLRAQDNPAVHLDENGNGSLVFPEGILPSNGTLQPDPGPGGLALALTYSLSYGAVATGDVFLFDVGNPLVLSEVIRFNPPGAGNPDSATVVFYSLAAGSDLADTGFPTQIYANNVALAENANGVTSYTPAQNQPGFLAGEFRATYYFNSPAPVPEPATLSLLGLGAGALLMAMRTHRRS